MRVERGSLQDAGVAQLYTVAFPESAALFFENKSPEKRLDLFELTFPWSSTGVLRLPVN